MNRSQLPAIRLASKPAGLKFRAPESSAAKWDRNIRAAAKADETTEISILGEIGESFWSDSFTTAKMVNDQLKAVGKGPVTVLLNSPGGDAFEGVAIYNLLRAHAGRVTVKVIGLAASAASVIAMAGDRVEMGPGTTMMIHSAWGVVMGNQNDLREFADVLDMLDRSIASIYAARTGLSDEEVLELMQAETWMSAEDCVDQKFADTVSAGKAAAKNRTDLPASFAPPALLAASGDRLRPVVRLSASTIPARTGSPHPPHIPGAGQMNIAEQRIQFENRRAANVARMAAIMTAAGETGSTLDETQTTEYDGLATEVSSIDAHLQRLTIHETTVLARANPVLPAAGADAGAAAAARQPQNSGIISVRQNIEPGVRFARIAIAMHQARGQTGEAARIFASNKRWMDQTPELHKVLMAAVPAADTTTAGWASEIAYARDMQEEFVEYLRPMTILGRLTDVRRVPFNVRMGSMTSGTTGYWVGQGKPIPMSKGATSSLSLGITKAAGLSAYDDELLKISSPSIELMVRNDLAKAVAQTLDTSFIDPNNGGQTNIQPASVLYGVTPITPSGTNAAAVAADVASVFAAAIAANLDPMSGVWIMSPTTALKLSLMQTSLGQPQYPGLTIKGGVWQGLPVIVSANASISGSPQFGNMIVLVLQNEIFVADDGDVDIQISNEASLEMLDNPTNQSTGGTTATSMVSMFQTQSWAIKAVRYANWLKRRSAAAAFIQAASYA